MITYIIVAILVIYLLFELTGVITIGWYLSNKTVSRHINKCQPFIINPYDPKILSATSPYVRFAYISYLPFPSLIGKYYIENKGIVPRWSKGHRQINKIYKELNNKK